MNEKPPLSRFLTTHGQRCFSSKCRIILIVIMLILVCLLIEGMMYLQSDISHGVRAYVRGEGLWAKAQKDAIYHLNRYATSGEQNDYRDFLNVLQVPLGDKQARLALQKEIPDLRLAKEGLLMGQNHPADVEVMIRFFLRFQDISYLRDAIEIWTKADHMIGELQKLATELKIAKAKSNHDNVANSLQKLHLLNEQLSQLENEFSLTLEEGARWIKHTIITSSILLLITVLFIVLIISSKIIKSIIKTEHDLLVSKNRFRSLMQSDLLGIVAWHSDGRILDANKSFLYMLGLDGFENDETLLGTLNWHSMTPTDYADKDEQAWNSLKETGVCHPYEKEFYHTNGKRVPVYMGAALLDGEHEEGICFVMDLTDRKRNETQLRLAATVFDSSNEGILVTDSRLRIVTMNKAFCEITGYKNSDLLGHTPRAFRSGLMSDDFYSQMWASLETSGHWQGDILDRKRGGAILPVRLSISAVRDANKKVSHYVAIFTDISERKAAEEQLQNLAHYDQLTGLANRNLLTDRLEHAIQRAKRNNSLLAVLFFDLDRFKPVNDEFGHEVGDKLLREIARHLQTTIRGCTQ